MPRWAHNVDGGREQGAQAPERLRALPIYLTPRNFNLNLVTACTVVALAPDLPLLPALAQASLYISAYPHWHIHNLLGHFGVSQRSMALSVPSSY